MKKGIEFDQPLPPSEEEPPAKIEFKKITATENVPKNAQKAIDYYAQKRRDVVKNNELANDDKFELIANYDRNRVAKIVEDEESYKKYFTQNHNLMESKFVKGANGSLMKALVKEHMNFGPNVSFIAPKNNPLSGLSFRSDVSGIEYYNDEKTKMRVDLDIVELNKPHIKHRSSIYINKELNEIRTAVIPEGLQTQNPSVYVRKLFNVPRIELEAILSMVNLSKSIEYDPRVYQGGRISPQGLPREIKPTKIEEEIPSTLPYRRRKIEEIDQVQSSLDELLSSWSDDERKILQDEGGGDIIMRVYSQNGGYCFIGSAPSTNLALIERMTSRAVTIGKALITFEHAWRPPELDEAPPGSPHRPHTRRLRGGVVLVVGNSVPQKERKEIVDIWRKRKRGLSDNEQNRLWSFLEKYGMSHDIQVDLIIANGIHYKDGKFISGAGSGPTHEYSN